MKWFLLAYLILSIFLFDPKLFKGGDNVQYMLLAESLATGQGYRDIFLVDSPKHWVWPPGFPALLVPVFWIFGRSAVAMKVLVMLIGLAGYYFYCKLAQFALTPPADRWAMTLYLTCRSSSSIITGSWLTYRSRPA